jgi:hypothetical protein
METTTPSEDVLLEVLRATRWEVTGGKGTAPDLTDVRGDCLEEIAAEFFEGEPGTFHKGKALVRFGASRERMFFVSELFTEYDPFARTWKTFHISRHGTDVLSIAACRQDGSALDGYEQRTFHDLEKRGVAHYTGTSSEARIQISFQPTPHWRGRVICACKRFRTGSPSMPTGFGFAQTAATWSPTTQAGPP